VSGIARYLGQLDAVEDARNADLFLLTSENSFGLAARAMSSGVPVIGTTAEGIPD
jgi:glycosyltransferase involved in cell wall biosynthesis